MLHERGGIDWHDLAVLSLLVRSLAVQLSEHAKTDRDTDNQNHSRAGRLARS